MLAGGPGGGVQQVGGMVAVDGVGADVAVGVVERQAAIGEGVGDGVRMHAGRVGDDGLRAGRKSRGGGQAATQRMAAEDDVAAAGLVGRSEEHTSELQSLMRISYAVFCLKKKK